MSMKLEQLKVLVKASNNIFIWSQLNSDHGAYFQVTKAALNDYLRTITTTSDFPVEIDEIGALYLGKNPDLDE